MDRKAALVMAAGSMALAAGVVILKEVSKRKKNKRSVWMKNWISRREGGDGVLHMLQYELRGHDEFSFTNYLRMNIETFDELLAFVGNDLLKNDTNMREAICPRDRLSLTLRFLATGESYRSLMYSTRIHYSTISQIVPEVCESIYKNLTQRGYVKLPQTEEDWRHIANNFEKKWNYPMCLGAIDGKHVAFRPPRSAGSYYYNYKGFHSIVLLAVVDSNYRFIYADVGVNGRISDGGVLRRSSLFKALHEGKLNLPRCVPLPGRVKRIQYHFIGDDAFSLSPHLMRPYPLRNITPEKSAFNYRLSRARRVVENAFGILSNRFRIFLTTINLSPEKVDLVILTCVTLHNFLITKNSTGYLDTENVESTLTGLDSEIGQNPSTTAKIIRDELRQYFFENPL